MCVCETSAASSSARAAQMHCALALSAADADCIYGRSAAIARNLHVTASTWDSSVLEVIFKKHAKNCSNTYTWSSLWSLVFDAGRTKNLYGMGKKIHALRAFFTCCRNHRWQYWAKMNHLFICIFETIVPQEFYSTKFALRRRKYK